MSPGMRTLAALLLFTTVVPRLAAQDVPAIPAAPAPPPAAGGIAGLCAMIDAKLQACLDKICACPLGQMLTNGAKPINLFAGGLLCPPCCPPIKDADKKKPANTPQGACARIRQEEMEAPERRAAVRCLAYADCNWYPEAEAALIVALRTDRNECVRWEAAMVLGTGCCCTRKTIEALVICVSSSKKDGNPPENSPRVKAAAYASLQHCLHNYVEVEVLEALPKPEGPDRLPEPRPVVPGPVTTAFQLIEPVRPVVALQPVPQDPLIVEARRIITDMKVVATDLPTLLPTGQHSLYDALVHASAAPPPPAGPASSAPPPLAMPMATGEPMPERPARSMIEWFHNRMATRPTAGLIPMNGAGPVLEPPPAPARSE